MYTKLNLKRKYYKGSNLWEKKNHFKTNHRCVSRKWPKNLKIWDRLTHCLQTAGKVTKVPPKARQQLPLSDHQRVPQASLTLAKVSVYDSTICSRKKTTASYLTLWLSTLLSVWRTWGVPTPTKHRNPQKKTCMEVEVIRRGGALLLLFNMPRWGKHVGRQARQ